jgi:hypothetical protein
MADQESIAKRAHELYLQRGSVPGHELDDWLQAEMELSAAESPEEHETPSERPVTTGGARRNRREQQTQPSNRRSLRP